jgi:hypothetical protein
MRKFQHRHGHQDNRQGLDQKLRDGDIRCREHDEDQRNADAHNAQCRDSRHAAAAIGRQKSASGDEHQYRPVLEEKAVELLAGIELDGPSASFSQIVAPTPTASVTKMMTM